MLFGYTRDATNDNWLHACLVEMVRDTHDRARSSMPLPKWPGSVPEPYRERLRSRTGLRDRLTAYRDAIESLTAEEHDRVLKAVSGQNRIAGLLAGGTPCARLADLPEAVRVPAKGLFKCAFGLLGKLEIRDKQYELIYDSMPHKICPFCGDEFFDAPTAPREDLDHYLAISVYPFAGANLLNLVPMGGKCNERFKGPKDILRADGTTGVAFDPYGTEPFVRAINLDDSTPPRGDVAAEWQIGFDADPAKAQTWDAIFDIRTRYMRDVLPRWYNGWITEFASYYRSSEGQVRSDPEELIQGLWDHHARYRNGRSENAFLKAAVFHMLWSHCSRGDDGLTKFLSDLCALEVIA